MFKDRKCPGCGFEQPLPSFPLVGCLMVLGLLALAVGAYFLFR
jgi:hypothetical protein